MSENNKSTTDEADDPAIDINTLAVTSSYKILGEFSASDGVGVLGQNNADSGTPIGVQGAVPNNADGYGLATPDDASVGGTAELNALGGPLTGNQTVSNLLGDGLAVGSGVLSVGAGRTLTTSGGQVDFAGPAEWENVGDTATNTASGSNATVAGGTGNSADGIGDTVGGGENNAANGGPATVAGGTGNNATAEHAVVSGGANNDSLSLGSFIGGGARNEVNGNYATIGGGNNNLITADYATIAGGNPSDFSNEDATRNAVYDSYGTIGGGGNNQAGSDDGTANAEYATVPGGRNNTASGAYSTAIGRNATANEDGSFVVGDATDTEVTPGSSDEARFQTSVVSESFIETGSSYYFDGSRMLLNTFGDADTGNDVLAISVPDVYGIPITQMRVNEFGDVEITGGLEVSGIQSDTGTNLVINSNDEIAVDSSSARHKTDVQPHSTSSGVLNLELRSFQYEETGSEDVGFIAEEVEEHVPEIVTYDDEDRPFGVKYDRIGAHLVPEVRDNRDRLGDVESDHEAMTNRVADLEAELDAQDHRLDDQQDRIEKLEAENERLAAENEALCERLAAIEDELDIDADQQAVADD